MDPSRLLRQAITFIAVQGRLMKVVTIGTASPIFSPAVGRVMFREVEQRIFPYLQLGRCDAMVADNGERLGGMFRSHGRRISPWLPDAGRRLLTQDGVQQRRADQAAANKGFHG